MKSSEKASTTLDFENDLLTTADDIKALQTNRPIPLAGDLSNPNQLRSPFPTADETLRRRVFPDQPPFEL